MKKTLTIIALFVLGAFTIWWSLGSLTMFINSDIDMSDRIGGGIMYFIFAIIFAVPFIIILYKYLKNTKADREYAKKIQALKIEENIQLKQIELEKEKQLKQQRILEKQNELEGIVSHNNAIAETHTHNSTKATISQDSYDSPINSSELLLLKIDSISTSGVYFENVACELLHANGFYNITKTTASNDFGIDILAEKDGISYAIQCKCYSSPIGNKAVQEAYTGKMYYKRMVAVVLTNSTFTKSAIETAEATQVILWDRSKLVDFISSMSECELTRIINQEYAKG